MGVNLAMASDSPAGGYLVEWSVKSIDEITIVYSGGTPSTSMAEYYGGDVPWITSSDLNQGEIFQVTGGITQKGLANSSAKMVAPGTLLLALYGATAGVTAITRIQAAINQAVLAIVPRTTSVNSEFLYYVLLNNKERIISTFTQGGQPNLSGAVVKALEFKIPPIAEQQAIATALSDTDTLISSLEKLIAKKRNIKQGAMQELLTGKMRLPGFGGEWVETTLGEIGECVIGLTYKPTDVVSHGLLVLRSSNIQNGQLAYHDNVYVNVEVPEKLRIKDGDILICVRNGSRALIGKCVRLTAANEDMTFGAFMSVYRSKYSRFVLHLFQTKQIQVQIHENIGATINQITNKNLTSFKVTMPQQEEQDAIVHVLDNLEGELVVLESKLRKLQMLKQAMMQVLLTGKIRLI